MVLPAAPEDVAAALRLAHRAGVPVFALGLGSNVLLPDEGLDALVIRLGKGLDGMRNEAARWWLGAGLPAPLAARKTAEQGWGGIHMMVGVPGTVGGGVFMNAGCHGGQWADTVERVTVVNRSGDERSLTAKDLWSVFGSKGAASDVLHRRRAISKRQAKKLAQFFHVTADLFI